MTQMDPTESEKISLIFKAFDGDNDGLISNAELLMAMRRIGVTGSLSDFNTLFNSLDLDENGYIDSKEFLRLYYMVAKQVE